MKQPCIKVVCRRFLSMALAILLCLAALAGCDSGGNKTVNYDDFSFETVNSATGYGYSTLTSLLSEGYVADTVKRNIADWLLSAYEKNPGIIDCIKDHSLIEAHSFGNFVSDGWRMMEAGVSSVAVSESAGAYGHSVVWTNHKAGNYTDLDFLFGNAASSRKDWTAYDQLWVYVDAKAYGNEPIPVGIAFEEQDTEVNGKLGSDRESWGIRPGGSVTLVADDGTVMQVTAVSSITAINENKGRVMLPAGFAGWIRLDLNADTLQPYWHYPKGNGTLDKKDCHHFILNVEGTASSAGKSLNIGPFMLSETRDAAPASYEDKAFADVWRLGSLKNGELQYADNVVFVFYGEFPGKLLTGISYAYTLSPSEELKRAGDELTQALADAQYEDGYLGLFDGTERLGGSMNWDTWAQYHILFGLLQWYQTTGNRTAYEVMLKSADYIMSFFRENNRAYSYGTPMCNLGIAHAFALIYLETQNEVYRKEAEKIIENDWQDCGDWLKNIEAGLEFYEMKNQYGNRWEPLHSVMALGTVGRITGNERYLKAFEDLYQSILKTDRRNNGSFSYGEEACGNLFANGTEAAVETCCSVAWMALTTDYLCQTLDSRAADEAELSYYNIMLGALMENGRIVTYNTPSDGKLVPSQVSIAFQTRDFSPDFNCCQANSARGLSEISRWAVLNAGNGLYLNWYGESAAKVQTPSGKPMTLVQSTVYPRNGQIRLTVQDMEEAERFTLFLRVPGWASSYTVKVGDKTYSAEKVGCYLPITGTWQNGATVEIDIGMTVHFLVGEADVKGKTSVYYGPILLALDSHHIMVSLFNTFTVEEILHMEIVAEEGLLLAAHVKNKAGRDVKLIAFADVGSGGSTYQSWLTVEGEIEALTYQRDGRPIWCAMAK